MIDKVNLVERLEDDIKKIFWKTSAKIYGKCERENTDQFLGNVKSDRILK